MPASKTARKDEPDEFLEASAEDLEQLEREPPIFRKKPKAVGRSGKPRDELGRFAKPRAT